MKKLVLLVAVLAACGKKSEEKKDEPSKETKDKDTKEPDKDKPAAPDAAPAVPDAAPVPKLTAPPTAESLTFEPCELDGTPVTSDSFSDAIGDIAVAGDGSIYVVFDKGHELRKYKAVGGPTCKLALDATFADKGVMKVDEEHKITAIALDGQGKLLVAGGKAITRWAGATAEASCTFDWTPDRFTVMPSGDKLLVNTFMNDLFEVTLAADPAACTKTAWTAKIEGLKSLSTLDRIGDQLLIVGKDAEGQSGFSAFTVGADGTMVAKLEISDESNAPNGLCWSAGAIACGTGICIADNNCRDLDIFTAEGKFVGSRDLDGYPWVTAWAGPHGGAAYVAYTQGDETDSSKNHARIQRVRGL